MAKESHKKEKDFFKENRLLIGAIVVLLIIAAFVLILRTPQEGTTVKTETQKEGEISLSSLEITKQACVYLGDTPRHGHLGQYLGNVMNNGEDTAFGVKVTVKFYDSDGNLVGTNSTKVIGNDIDPGDDKGFFAYAGNLDGRFASCEITLG